MGFGVKYTGPDGKKRSFEMDSVPKSGSELADLTSSRGRFPDFRRQQNAAVARQNEQNGVKVMLGGGVVEGRDGSLCLRGEEDNPLVQGVKVFSSVNGEKGYHTLDEIDPQHGGGARVGPEDECDQEDPVADARTVSDGNGWATSVAGRIVAKRESGHTVIYQYTKDLLVTPGQRLVGVTAEHRRVVCIIPSDGRLFHLGLTIEDGTATVGDGAVQVGGYTRFFQSSSISLPGSGLAYICISVSLNSDAAPSLVSFTSEAGLKAAQDDMTKYIFPIYLIEDGDLILDYRPMSNAGCWE